MMAIGASPGSPFLSGLALSPSPKEGSLVADPIEWSLAKLIVLAEQPRHFIRRLQCDQSVGRFSYVCHWHEADIMSRLATSAIGGNAGSTEPVYEYTP